MNVNHNLTLEGGKTSYPAAIQGIKAFDDKARILMRLPMRPQRLPMRPQSTPPLRERMWGEASTGRRAATAQAKGERCRLTLSPCRRQARQFGPAQAPRRNTDLHQAPSGLRVGAGLELPLRSAPSPCKGAKDEGADR